MSTLLADKLKGVLEAKDMSQTELARSSGLSLSYVNDLVLGRRGNRISSATERKLKTALEVEDSFFLPESSVEAEKSTKADRRVRA